MKTFFLKLKKVCKVCKVLKDWTAFFFSQVFWKDKIVIWGLTSALFLNLVLLFLIYFKTPDSNLPLILHYSVYRGVDFLGERYMIYYLPAILLVFILFNLILADFFYKKEKLLSHFFVLSLPVIAAFFLFAAINLIIINT